MDKISEEIYIKILDSSIDYYDIKRSIKILKNINLTYSQWSTYYNKSFKYIVYYSDVWYKFIKYWDFNYMTVDMEIFIKNFLHIINIKSCAKFRKKEFYHDEYIYNLVLNKNYPYYKFLINMNNCYTKNIDISDMVIAYTDNLEIWYCFIIGPAHTIYSGNMFELEIKYKPCNLFKITIDYIKFKTQIYHPNINKEGYLLLDLNKDTLSPTMIRINKLLILIQSIIAKPILDCTHLINNNYNINIYKEYTTNLAIFNSKSKKYTRFNSIDKINNNFLE